MTTYTNDRTEITAWLDRMRQRGRIGSAPQLRTQPAPVAPRLSLPNGEQADYQGYEIVNHGGAYVTYQGGTRVARHGTYADALNHVDALVAPPAPPAPVAHVPSFPPAHLVAAALENASAEYQQCLDRLLALPKTERVQPDYKDEVSFWKSQINAHNKALAMWQAGIRAQRTPSGGYLVPSATRPGAVLHRLFKEGSIWRCGCEAGAYRLCWHHAVICGIERAEDLAALDDDMGDLPFALSGEEVMDGYHDDWM